MICAYCGREAVGRSLSCPGCGAPPQYLPIPVRPGYSHDILRYGKVFQDAWEDQLTAMRYYVEEMGKMPSDYYRDPLVRQAVAAKMRARG